MGFQKINLLDSIHIYVKRIKIEILLEEWEVPQIKYYFKKIYSRTYMLFSNRIFLEFGFCFAL